MSCVADFRPLCRASLLYWPKTRSSPTVSPVNFKVNFCLKLHQNDNESWSLGYPVERLVIVAKPALVLHVQAGHDGPDGGGEEGGQPADQEVDPVVGRGVVEENVHHQDIVEVETLNYYFINLSWQKFHLTKFLRNLIKYICLPSLFAVPSTLIILLSPPETSSETSQFCCTPAKSRTIDKAQSSKRWRKNTV